MSNLAEGEKLGVQPSTSMGYSREPVWGDSMKISNNLGHIQDVHK